MNALLLFALSGLLGVGLPTCWADQSFTVREWARAEGRTQIGTVPPDTFPTLAAAFVNWWGGKRPTGTDRHEYFWATYERKWARPWDSFTPVYPSAQISPVSCHRLSPSNSSTSSRDVSISSLQLSGPVLLLFLCAPRASTLHSSSSSCLQPPHLKYNYINTQIWHHKSYTTTGAKSISTLTHHFSIGFTDG